MIFHRPKWEKGEGLEKGGKKSKGKVIHIIVKNSTITAQEIAEHLRRIGPTKGGHWEVVE
ncbi:MAG: hypothetical protein K8S27_08015 [Candidatus Omnitrophica bacterium]|nr:hypothetical protein [Candidatus Omnitrophota bacterium]